MITFNNLRIALFVLVSALLLLKGLSTREVAAVRSTSERTVREQARSVYVKAGLTGRAALSAFFLEDLLAPIDVGACDTD